jgi:hypothetical protein
MTPWSEAAEQVDTIADEGPTPDEREAVEDCRLLALRGEVHQ